MSDIDVEGRPPERAGDGRDGPEGLGGGTRRQRLKKRAERGAGLRASARMWRAGAEAAAAAGEPSGAEAARREAEGREARAAALSSPPEPLGRGAGGELRLAGGLEAEHAGLAARVADGPGALEADASLDRLELLNGAGCVSLGLEAADALAARDALERMLAHQLAAAHRLAMRFVAKADQQLSQVADWQSEPRQQAHAVEAARLAGTSARLMASFQDGLVALGRYRSGGRQQVVVQRIDVADGGRAVVAGVVAPPGGRGEGSDRK